MRRGHLPIGVSAGAVLIVAVAPVVYDPWGYDAFGPSKVVVTVVGLALCATGLAWRRELVIPRHPMVVLGALALTGLSIASVTANNPLRALTGAPLRNVGLVAWMGFAVAMITGFAATRQYGARFAEFVMASAVVGLLGTGAVGFIELLGVDPVSDSIVFESRVRSTFGNPAMFAGYLVLVLPLVVVAAGREGWLMWPARLAVGLGTIHLVSTQTRAVLLAGLVVATLLGLARLRARARGAVIVFLVVVAVASGVSGRWSSLGHAVDGRAAIWAVAVESVADAPLLGSGPEGFIVDYGEHVDDDTVIEFGRVDVVDRAHNGLLDFVVAAGVPAGLLYLATIAGVAVLAVRRIRDGDALSVAIAAGILAYLLQQIAFFPHPVTDTALWMMVGVLIAGHSVGEIRAPRSAVAIGALLALWLLYAATGVVNDRRYESALEASTFLEAYLPLERAADMRPWDDLPYILMGELLAATPDHLIVQRGLSSLEDGARRNPGNELVALALADTRLQAFRLTGDDQFAIAAAGDLGILLAEQPANGDAALKRGTALFYLDDFAGAAAEWRRAEYLLPDRSEPTNNLEVLAEMEET